MCSDVSTGVLIGEFCGSEAENAELNGITIDEIAQLHLINGTLVGSVALIWPPSKNPIWIRDYATNERKVLK